MKITVRTGKPESVKGALLVVVTPTTSGRLPRNLKPVDSALGGLPARLVRDTAYAGAVGDTALGFPGSGPRRLLLVGSDSKGAVTRDSVRRAAASAARQALDLGIDRLTILAPPASAKLSAETIGQAVAEGLFQGAWRFDEMKEDDDAKKEFVAATLLVDSSADRRAYERGCTVGTALGAGQSFARRLQALPGNVCTPSYLAEVAEKLGREHGFTVTVYDRERLKRMRMGALLAVSAGSEEEPKLISLEYKGGKGAPVCLVGKGVTFDTGGISLKPPANMEEMKFDMSGAAAVLGAFHALGQLRPDCNVVGVIPTTENLPSGTAVKPGDIVRSHSGKTIEILNTDAEGRLILADALSFTKRFKPACVIDAATLTGAVVVALGHHATGLMANDDELSDEILKAADAAGERCWPLPLWDEYRKSLDSDYADIKNIGGRAGSSITAGWFLREFVGDFPWAHLDIAGTAYGDADAPHMASGPTGVGVRLFTEFVLGRAH